MKNYLALKASAGSGKTFALTVRYISLLLLGANAKQILTLTFTNKAANEMSERIFKTLLTLGEDEIYLNEIIKETKLSKDIILENKNKIIKHYLESELSIYTIDKFVNKILREFCGYIGVNDDFDIKEDDVENLSYKFLQSLNLEEFDKLINFSFHESKKFNSIFELFQILIEKNEQFDIINIDAKLISLQKEEAMKIAYKLKEHILNCEQASAAATKSVEFNSFDELLKKGKTWLSKKVSNDSRDFKKCTNDEFENNFQDLKLQINIYYKLRSSYSLSSLYELYVLFRNFKNRYNKNKNYFTFNDISNLVNELLLGTIDKDFLYFRLDSTYNHILIDEFQDTSLLQYRILEPLIEEILSGNHENFKTFFYVGDTKQSIYRFRGGKRELFDYVNIKNPQIEVEVLNTNYRSANNIVDFVNKRFLGLTNYEYYEQLSNIKNGYVEVISDSSLEEDEKFVNIAKKIEELLLANVNPNNIAILTYTNADVLSLYSYLSQKFPSLKISTEMTSRLTNQENVKALINAVKYFYYKEDIYKENLHAIIGEAPLTNLEVEFDLYKYRVQELIYKIANELNIIDDNVIKFVEVSTSYKDIIDFIYEIDKLETPMENKEQSGLQILTIFKSKGLEFDTVILLDRIKRKNVDKSSILFEYSNIDLKNVYYKISGLENFDENYAYAIEKEKKLALDDEINILYVALTRAKNNLFIFKKEDKSVFDILSLSDVKIGSLIVSKVKETLKIKDEKIVYKALSLGRQKSKSTINQDDNINNLDAKYFGIATHYCLEMMSEFNNEELNFCLDLTKSRFSNYIKEKDFIDIRNRIKLLLCNEIFLDLVKGSTYSTEQSLTYKDELKIIDLLIKKDDKYYIIDYKTTSEEHQEHILQVNYYKKAIKNIVCSDYVYGYIVYLKENSVYLKTV